MPEKILTYGDLSIKIIKIPGILFKDLICTILTNSHMEHLTKNVNFLFTFENICRSALYLASKHFENKDKLL